MSGELRVTTSHVRELGERQGTAAQQIEAAGAAAQGVGMSMMGNHGVVCLTSNMAVTMAEQARAAAAAKMNLVSTGLSEKLGIAATLYDRADAQGAGKLDKEMHPR
ncbi:ESX-1 secretion-associated protein [Mycobacterium sp. TNTM28]|uniref:ESX-1 secretion-associated protein n=1 Tax=[Mycobacterium] fortunisiensis TaxID=2600579 RepID=A0ABS6KGP7_9MYCO|nr:ESX-1 secretion-associated protein [[Mycobacterium] fortunisiensis]MBU9762733.1 ESX-1 secretion-associated protein [[Mycobacterium] fortunisiensis]